MNPQTVRPSPIAGTWYPGSPDALARQVDGYIQDAQLPADLGEVVAVIAPHAGYIYSGPTAGYAFRALQGRSADLAVVISPFHSYAGQDLLTSAYEAYATPLGEIPVDREAIEELNAYLESKGYTGLAPAGKESEHSVEIELPFLQRALDGDFKLLPIMVSCHDFELLIALGEGLAEVLRSRQAVLVASTDLSHFYTQEQAKTLDDEILKQIEAFSPQGLWDVLKSGAGEACGGVAVIAVMTAARSLGAVHAAVLDYSTSGDTSGDYQRVVGYAAAALTKA